jgi:chaperonin GroES
MKVKPLGDKILVKRAEAETKTASGLYLPDTAAEKPQQAEVLEVGEGKVSDKTGQRISPSVKKGDKVLLSKWGGTEIKVAGQELLIISEDDVLAIVQ